MILFEIAFVYLFVGSLVWMFTINAVARQFAISSMALHRSRSAVLHVLTVLTILLWPRVLFGYAWAYLRQIEWRRGR